jgi:hypothetical protein
MQVLQRFAVGCALVLAVVASGCGDDGTGDGGGGSSGGMPFPPVGVPCGGFTCAVGQTCVNNACTTPCTMDAECPGQACCTGACVPTVSDRNNCGGCGMICAATETCTAGACTAVMCNTSVLPEPGNDGGVDDDAGVDTAEPPIGSNGCPTNEQCAVSGNTGVCQCGAGPSCPEGQPCGTDGACHCGAGMACTTGATCCGGTTCASLLSDAMNCGSCGNACPTGQSCNNGSCGCANSTDSVCDDSCVNLQTDEANCGTCGNTCAAEAQCTNGACTCPNAGELGCDGHCVPVNTDEHCGACTGCPNADSGGASCQDLDADGAFECSCTTDEEAECDGSCEYIITDDHCGSCDNVCGVGTDCQDTGDGTLDCLCAGFPDVQLCDDGAGGETCVDVTASDEDNCGGCGIACEAGDNCVNGQCDCSSSPGEIFCDRGSSGDPADYACGNPLNRRHCFDCDNTCPADSSCNGTAMDCVCTDNAEIFCDDGVCANTDTDATHCGNCDTACTGTEVCGDGICCPAAKPDNCSGVCQNLKTDRTNCGTCGNTCGDSCGFIFTHPCACNNGTCEQ